MRAGTAGSLGHEAGLDLKEVSELLGHSSIAITADIYPHLRQPLHDANAEKIVALIKRPGEAKETGS